MYCYKDLSQIKGRIENSIEYGYFPAGTVQIMYVHCTYSWYNVRTLYVQLVQCTYIVRTVPAWLFFYQSGRTLPDSQLYSFHLLVSLLREIHPLDPQPHRYCMLASTASAPRVTCYSLGLYWSRDLCTAG